jgi:hypothetical protein
MKVGFLRPSIEKDFEFFVRNLPKLEPVEFCGIAKILSVPLYKQIGMETIDPKELKEMNEEERYNLKLELMVPMDEIWEKMMDRYLELPKRRRKEINQILKDAQRGK